MKFHRRRATENGGQAQQILTELRFLSAILEQGGRAHDHVTHTEGLTAEDAVRIVHESADLINR